MGDLVSHIFDILVYELPVVTVVHDSLWKCLRQEDHASIRLTCQSGRQLFDILTGSVTLDLSSGVQQQQKQQQQQRSFVSRLPRLTALKLVGWGSTDLADDGQGCLTAALEQLGAAAGGRVRSLSLSGPALSRRTSSAVHAAFPLLQGLTLDSAAAAGGFQLGQGGPMRIDRHVFLQLSSALTKLVFKSGCDVRCPELLLLGGLTHLRHLDVTAHGAFLPSALQPLASLVHLTSCRLCAPRALLKLSDVCPLLTLTRLQHLALVPVLHSSSEDWAAGGVPAALTLLGRLVDLRTLQLFQSFHVNDAALAAIGRLTRLTRLEVGRTAPAAAVPPPGHLPLLQRLVLKVQAPEEVLAALQPLLPLPCLTHIGREVEGDAPQSVLTLDISAASLHCRPLRNPAKDTVQRTPTTAFGAARFGRRRATRLSSPTGPLAAAKDTLRELATALAGAPRLVLHGVRLISLSRVHWDVPLWVVAAGLQPLADRIHSLDLRDLGAGAGLGTSEEWQHLGSDLPHLRWLVLGGSPVSEMGEGCCVAVAVQLRGLRRLEFQCGCREETLLQLARMLRRPLELHFGRPLPAGVVARVQAEEEHAHGGKHLIWLS